MPIGIVARKPGDFQAHHDPCPPHADFGDQRLEAFTVIGRRTGLAQIVVDDDELLDVPTQCDSPLLERILTLRTFGIVQDLR